MIEERVHELTNEVSSQTLRLERKVDTCATCWAYVARDMAVSAFALIDIPIDHDISDTAVEGEVSLQRAASTPLTWSAGEVTAAVAMTFPPWRLAVAEPVRSVLIMLKPTPADSRI